MENLTIYQLIEYISNNWEHIHHIGDEKRVQHFFLERTPAELLGFAKELDALKANKRQGGSPRVQ